jgi:FtsH-binding integral membrane protein
VLYDTSRIMTRLNYDQAPEGALSLYLDFVNLLLLIMDLLGGRRR